jgi:hypothetical protein
MTKIKLKDWADKNGLSYLTANRHFHAGMIPGAVQLDSGTILVEDESPEQNMAGSSSNDAMSLFIKKTVEYSKNNSTIEDFAAFIVATFQLKLQGATESPRYSKNRPKPEDVQKHFQQFLPDQKEVEHLKAVKTLIKEGKTAGEVVPASNLSPEIAELSERLGHAKPFERVSPISEYPVDDFSLMLATAEHDNQQAPPTVEGLVSRSVDLNTTPQQINYTGSTSQAFSLGGLTSGAPTIAVANNCYAAPAGSTASFLSATSFAGAPTFDAGYVDGSQGVFYNAAGPAAAATPPFQPTQKELESAAKVIETADAETAPRKRGRKPTFKKG